MRFNSEEINEKMETYCIPTIKTSINKLGGIDLDNDAMKRFFKQYPDADYPTYFEEFLVNYFRSNPSYIPHLWC